MKKVHLLLDELESSVRKRQRLADDAADVNKVDAGAGMMDRLLDAAEDHMEKSKKPHGDARVRMMEAGLDVVHEKVGKFKENMMVNDGGLGRKHKSKEKKKSVEDPFGNQKQVKANMRGIHKKLPRRPKKPE